MPNQFDSPQDSPSGLAPVSHGSNKSATRRKAGSKNDRSSTEDALLGFVREVDQEIATFEGETDQVVRGIARKKAVKLRQVVEKLPTIYHEEVQKELGSLEVDPESFRASSGTLRGRLFAAVGLSEADDLVIERIP